MKLRLIARFLSPAMLVAGEIAIASDSDVMGSNAVLDPVSDWQVLPFFECAKSDYDDVTDSCKSSFFAVRPLWSTVSDVKTGSSVTDFLWPLGTCHSMKDRTWWRFLIFYGDKSPLDEIYRSKPTEFQRVFGRELEDNTAWSFNIFPLWFSGRTRQDESYWGFFPFYGHHPHFLLMDDMRFVCFPFYLDYSVKGVRSHVVLWPFVSWKDAPRSAFSVWPFYGWYHQRESNHRYALWPLVTWADYEADRDTSGAGYSWMVMPVYGRVQRERETQHLLLPPFFSFAKTDATTRWRLPWPFVDVELGPRRNRISIWPVWEKIEGFAYGADKRAEENTWRIGWKLIERTRLETDSTDEQRFSVFPFWTDEVRKVKKSDGEKVTGSFLRVWPFYVEESDSAGRKCGRVLDLIPIRHSGGIERNWSPFWTLYSFRDRKEGGRHHELLWGLIRFDTEGDKK